MNFINNAHFGEDEEEYFEKIILINSELKQVGADRKMSRLDLSASMKDGSTVNIEVQVLNLRDFRQRLAYHASLRHSDKLEKGETYRGLSPTIMIAVLAFNLLDVHSRTKCLKQDLSVGSCT